MTEATPSDQSRRPVRAALVRLFGRPRRKSYVQWSLAIVLGVGIFVGLWVLVPLLPKVIIHAAEASFPHAFAPDHEYLTGKTDEGEAPFPLAFSPDGKTLATSGANNFRHTGPIHLWDVETGRLRCDPVGDASPVYDVLFSPDGKLLAVNQDQRDLCLWETATGKVVAQLAIVKIHHESITTGFSPDGRFALIQRLPEFGNPELGTLGLWDIERGELQATLHGDVKDAVFIPGGERLVRATGTDGQVEKVELWQLGQRPSDVARLQEIGTKDRRVELSPNLARCATVYSGRRGQLDKTVIQLWDLTTGEELNRGPVMECRSQDIGLQFSPGGQFLVVHVNPFEHPIGHKYQIWDVNSGLKEVAAYSLHHQQPKFSRNDQWFLLPTAANEAELFDTETFQKHGTLWVPGDGVIGPMTSGVYQHASRYVWSGSDFAPDSRTAIVTGIEAQGGNAVTKFLGQYITAFRPKHVLVVRLWDVETAQEIATFTDCRQALYSPDGKTLATLHEDGTVKVWDIPPRKPILRICGVSLVLWLMVVVGVQLRRRLACWWFVGKRR